MFILSLISRNYDELLISRVMENVPNAPRDAPAILSIQPFEKLVVPHLQRAARPDVIEFRLPAIGAPALVVRIGLSGILVSPSANQFQLTAFDFFRRAVWQLLHSPTNSTRHCLIEKPAGNSLAGNLTGSIADSLISKIALHEEQTR